MVSELRQALKSSATGFATGGPAARVAQCDDKEATATVDSFGETDRFEGSGMVAIAELAEQVLDLLRPHLRLGVIERHRAMQSTLRSLEPLARLLQVAEEMDRMSE